MFEYTLYKDDLCALADWLGTQISLLEDLDFSGMPEAMTDKEFDDMLEEC